MKKAALQVPQWALAIIVWVTVAFCIFDTEPNLEPLLFPFACFRYTLGWAATLRFSAITAARVPYLDLTKKNHTCVAFHHLSPFLLSWTSIINGSPVPWFVENPISLQQFFRIVHLKRVTPDILNGPNSVLTNMRVCQNHLKGLSTPACWVLPNRGSNSVHLRWGLRICISSTSRCCSKDPTLRTTSPMCVLSSRH